VVRSMTGFGLGRAEAPGLEVTAEARSVNGRFLKVSIKAPQILSSRENDLEALVREKLKRGSVNLSVFLKRTDPSRLAAVNSDTVLAYKAAFERLGVPTAAIVLLPGVLDTSAADELPEAEWQAIVQATRTALEQLTGMREREGRATAESLLATGERMEVVRTAVLARAPIVVVEYRQKLAARLSLLIDNGTAGVDPELVAREVAVYADRSDVTEELARLAGHLEQARSLLKQGDDVGRRLDFLAQEMLREVNTIGSKSADSKLAVAVVELKSLIEQLKEQVANIE
jgi:uncharacterized protein (TIGR00255 family)